MIGTVRFVIALVFVIVGLVVGIAEAEIAMGPLQWFVAAIAVELLGEPVFPRNG